MSLKTWLALPEVFVEEELVDADLEEVEDLVEAEEAEAIPLLSSQPQSLKARTAKIRVATKKLREPNRPSLALGKHLEEEDPDEEGEEEEEEEVAVPALLLLSLSRYWAVQTLMKKLQIWIPM